MNDKKLKVCWISAGVSSFIAGYLERDTIDKFIYIDIDDQHPDSIRFIKDCERVLGRKIEKLESPYKSVEGAIRAAGVIRNANTGFSPCTNWLKKRIRKEWEYEHRDYDITYVWGFDCNEKNRADNLVESMFEFTHIFPLIDRNLTKQDAHGMCESLGIHRPVMYDLGYNNNNCIGCVKGGMGYWNKIRVDFPDVFESRSKLEREIGSSILKECYLDELDPDRGRMSEEIPIDCSIMCMLNI
jgi:hypothetical protein